MYKYAVVEKHPLRDCYAVFIPQLPYIPPYFGTLKECQKAAAVADKKAASMLEK